MRDAVGDLERKLGKRIDLAQAGCREIPSIVGNDHHEAIASRRPVRRHRPAGARQTQITVPGNPVIGVNGIREKQVEAAIGAHHQNVHIARLVRTDAETQLVLTDFDPGLLRHHRHHVLGIAVSINLLQDIDRVKRLDGLC
ncbi:MAG: hypothetical protein CAPSK01_003053 [Candidatus Accumulibacter vicinus]|uniref:Uncharacterized protein n=1 Tax=Candidatus Accumulibacter vicinus TaxID=2954382 RepID=A0A084XYR6_9PROT|nr:MAG: hypothetical protein CAPSK01_003053 [Candidatus Accumulibacter vicinus]